MCDNLFFARRINMICAFSISPVSNDVLSFVVDFDAESQISFERLLWNPAVARTRVAEITFIMLTNANVNRNDRQARTEEYLRREFELSLARWRDPCSTKTARQFVVHRER